MPLTLKFHISILFFWYHIITEVRAFLSVREYLLISNTFCRDSDRASTMFIFAVSFFSLFVSARQTLTIACCTHDSDRIHYHQMSWVRSHVSISMCTSMQCTIRSGQHHITAQHKITSLKREETTHFLSSKHCLKEFHSSLQADICPALSFIQLVT